MEFKSREWMVESAHRYLQAAYILANTGNLMQVAEVNAAFGIEILLKSLNSEVSSNASKPNEAYIPGKRGHNLLDLYESIDPDILRVTGLNQFESWVKRLSTTNIRARYPYEKEASKGYSSVVVDIGEQMLINIASYYKKNGAPEHWVEYISNIESL